MANLHLIAIVALHGVNQCEYKVKMRSIQRTALARTLVETSQYGLVQQRPATVLACNNKRISKSCILRVDMLTLDVQRLNPA